MSRTDTNVLTIFFNGLRRNCETGVWEDIDIACPGLGEPFRSRIKAIQEKEMEETGQLRVTAWCECCKKLTSVRRVVEEWPAPPVVDGVSRSLPQYKPTTRVVCETCAKKIEEENKRRLDLASNPRGGLIYGCPF